MTNTGVEYCCCATVPIKLQNSQHAMSPAEGTIMYLKEIDIKQVLTDATLHQPADLLDDSESLQSLAANIDKFNSTVLANLEERLSKGLHQISKVMTGLHSAEHTDFTEVAKVFQLDSTIQQYCQRSGNMPNVPQRALIFVYWLVVGG